LQEFLSNPWYFHFVSALHEISEGGVSLLKNMIPEDGHQERMREQAVGEIRGLERFEKITNEKLSELLASQAEQHQDHARNDSTNTAV
jgi:hypothetical protein